jgi:hypothetical protein
MTRRDEAHPGGGVIAALAALDGLRARLAGRWHDLPDDLCDVDCDLGHAIACLEATFPAGPEAEQAQARLDLAAYAAVLRDDYEAAHAGPEF